MLVSTNAFEEIERQQASNSNSKRDLHLSISPVKDSESETSMEHRLVRISQHIYIYHRLTCLRRNGDDISPGPPLQFRWRSSVPTEEETYLGFWWMSGGTCCQKWGELRCWKILLSVNVINTNAHVSVLVRPVEYEHLHNGFHSKALSINVSWQMNRGMAHAHNEANF